MTRGAAKTFVCAAAILLLVPPVSAPAAGENGLPDISASVVGVIDAGSQSSPGTGFFITPGGLVLTNAHVVHLSSRYTWPTITVLVGREWYGAKVVCSSPSGEGGPGHELPYKMDQAVLQITPAFTDAPWGYPLEYQPHLGPLPEFPALTLAKHGPQGLAVRTTGFSNISALPRLFTTTGEFTRTFSGQDGTPYFEMTFENPPDYGSSGSPIIDSTGTVVGIVARLNLQDRHVFYGISALALSATCGK